MRWPVRRRAREMQREIEAVQRETDDLKWRIEAQQPILDEALRRRDIAIERSRVAARRLEEVIAQSFREGVRDG